MMTSTIVKQVESWFIQNEQRLSTSFPIVQFRLQYAADRMQGKVNIELEGEAAGISITFWNKGDVTALVLEKLNNNDYPIDDRLLTPNDDIPSLLNSYVEKLHNLTNQAASNHNT